MDVITHRHLVAKARTYVRAVPFAWVAYGVYWRLRSWIEARRHYPVVRTLTNFGKYPSPTIEAPESQLCTANQLLTPIYRAWCRAMHSPARFSRKQWEFVYILQSLQLAGMLQPGKTGLGFGCGREPLAGLLAQHGCTILATDLAQD
jgi:hypothetical protein